MPHEAPSGESVVKGARQSRRTGSSPVKFAIGHHGLHRNISFPSEPWLLGQGLVIVLAVQDPQDGKEQVDNVEVQADAGGNLFLHMVMSHDQLCVHKNVAGEDECSDATVHGLHGRRVREERSHEPKDDQDPQPAEEVRHPGCKVVLALTGKDGKEDKDTQRDDQRFNDDATLVERRNDTDAVRLKRGKPRQKKDVCRIRLALPESEEHEADGAEQ